MVQRRAFKGTGKGGNKFVNRGGIEPRGAPITPPVKKSKPIKPNKNTKFSDVAGNPVTRRKYEKGSGGGTYSKGQENSPIVNEGVAKELQINKLKGRGFNPGRLHSGKARLLRLRLAGTYNETEVSTDYKPNYQLNPEVANKQKSPAGVNIKHEGAKPITLSKRKTNTRRKKSKATRQKLLAQDRKKKKVTKEDIEISKGLARTESEGGFGERTPSWEQGGN